MEKNRSLADFPYILIAMVSSYFVNVFRSKNTRGSECSDLKRLTNAALGRLQAFRMYGGIGMSTSSLHRESTDSLIAII